MLTFEIQAGITRVNISKQPSVLNASLVNERIHLKLHRDQSATTICSLLIALKLIKLNSNLGYFAIDTANSSVSRRDMVSVNLLKIKNRQYSKN